MVLVVVDTYEVLVPVTLTVTTPAVWVVVPRYLVVVFVIDRVVVREDFTTGTVAVLVATKDIVVNVAFTVATYVV